MGRLKELAIGRVETGQSQSLPADLWQEPVMVATFSHFGGDYPESPAHTCKGYWRARVDNGQVTSMAPITYKAWRPDLYSKGGKLLYCEGCWHDRVVNYCKQIERISLHYPGLAALSFSTVAGADRKKTADKIRQHNRRREDGEDQISYSTFPLEDARVIFFHDGGDYLPGAPVPADRDDLFNLINGWALTPRGKRAGHGMEKWATDGPKVKQPETENQPGDDGNQTEKKGGKQAGKVGYIYGANWQLVCRLVAAHMGGEDSPKGNAKGMKFAPGELPASELINLLDLAKIDYAIEGDIGTGQEQKGEESTPEPEPRPLLL